MRYSFLIIMWFLFGPLLSAMEKPTGQAIPSELHFLGKDESFAVGKAFHDGECWLITQKRYETIQYYYKTKWIKKIPADADIKNFKELATLGDFIKK